jgi:hypothetical protein
MVSKILLPLQNKTTLKKTGLTFSHIRYDRYHMYDNAGFRFWFSC